MTEAETIAAERAHCAKLCAGDECGDPPCWALEGTGPMDNLFVWIACNECALAVRATLAHAHKDLNDGQD